MNLLLIALGGAFGSVARYMVHRLVGGLMGLNFPYGTLLINISGSVIMGLFIGWLTAKGNLGQSESLRLFVAVGILGGYTTFSSFSLEAVNLMEQGRLGAMAAYIGSSVFFSLAGLLLGLRLMRSFT